MSNRCAYCGLHPNESPHTRSLAVCDECLRADPSYPWPARPHLRLVTDDDFDKDSARPNPY